MQPLILAGELRLLHDKARALRIRLSEVRSKQGVDPALFELIDLYLQENYNTLLEETVGLIAEVAGLMAKCKH